MKFQRNYEQPEPCKSFKDNYMNVICSYIPQTNTKWMVWLGLSFSVLINSSCNNDKESQKPNIVYILADDMGYGDVQCNNPDSKIPTPNIDRLASEGMRFTDGHSPAQICTPSRYSILTGRYYWRNKVYEEIGWRVIQAWQKPLIEPNRLTFPGMLKDQGYHTACIGKWHLGFNWQVKKGKREGGGNYKNLDYTKKVKGGPITRGFDYFFGLDAPNRSVAFIENDRHTQIPSQKPYNSVVARWADKTAEGWTFEKILPTLTQKALDYIERRSESDSAFFIYYALTAPHTPIAPDSAFIDNSGAGRYGDFVNQIDHDIGRIIQTLEEQGLYDNTVVIFSSDNGSPERDGTNYFGGLKTVLKYDHYPNDPWRGMKADLWEAGHRVPFIVRWPGVVKPNTTSDVPVSQIDFMRTFANYLEIELPKNAAEDSYNILPVLQGKQTDGHDPIIVYNSNKPTIRLSKWKLILDKGPTGFSRHAGYEPPVDAPEGQLYNMEKDPQEQNNLYDEKKEMVSRLKDSLEAYKKEGSSSF
jgi:arylsulfatase A-like enzyme